MKRYLIVLTSLLSFAAQAGSWQYYPFADKYRRVQCAGDELYMLQGDRLFLADARSWALTCELNRLQGLSGISIADIIYSQHAHNLAIVYQNGIIDFLHSDGTISSLADLKETPGEGMSKRINHVAEYDGILCISTDFGFMAIDMDTEVVLHSVNLGHIVTRTWMEGGSYFCRSKDKVTYTCSVSANIYNPSCWSISNTSSPSIPSLPSGAVDQCHSITGDSIYTLYPDNGLVSNVRADTLTINQYQHGDANNRLFFTHGTLSTCHVSDLTFFDYNTNVKAQGYLSEYDPETDRWFTMRHRTVTDHLSARQTFGGIMDMLPDPIVPHRYYYSSLENGIYIIQDGKLESRWDNFDGTTHIEAFAGNSARVGGLAMSPEGDLWYINEGVDDILRVRTSKGKWYKYPVTGASGQFSMPHLIHTQHSPNPMLWACRTAGYQKCILFAYDYGGTPNKASDDRSITIQKFVDENNRVIHPYYINNIVEGPNGAIWVLTSQGIYVIDQPNEVFEGTCHVRTAFDGVVANAMLFDSEQRIWIGTAGNGILLYDSAGASLLHHFTTDNCLLSSNEILALDFDSSSHTLWVSCIGSILSFHFDETEYSQDFISTACSYPSVARAEADECINIVGLTDGSLLKLRNAEGNIVFTRTAVGGMVTIYSSALIPGEYSVIGTDSEGQQRVVSSITIK